MAKRQCMMQEEDGPPATLVDDLEHYQQHYKDLFRMMEITYVAPDKTKANFRVQSRTDSKRTLECSLSETTCFQVEKDSQGDELCGKRFESFEQLLSALDGAEQFGTRLCDLVSEQLAKELGSLDFEGRFDSQEK
eukprot:TRINITY_DN114431_c0_g1_i1.p1 TRINITY_DN114431_c0_g1~~TRINITY_DN114431_c0_g1_i1.p1  ORF type:complete len:146 (-),score=30.07 TRINITY_DN114431_c0_g1_i1:101-505(-)